jgi:transcriptional antiterminator RfaH
MSKRQPLLNSTANAQKTGFFESDNAIDRRSWLRPVNEVSVSQLSSTTENNRPRWYAIYTKAKEEERAGNNLEAWGVKTFLPRIRDLHFSKYSRKPVSLLKHLFPRYIFAQFDADTLLHKVNFTRGVCKVVNFGNGPSPVDDVLIDAIKSQITAEGAVKQVADFNCGDSVMIKGGLFEKLQGTVECELADSDRLVILLSTVSYQGRLMIEKAMVRNLARSHDWVNA